MTTSIQSTATQTLIGAGGNASALVLDALGLAGTPAAPTAPAGTNTTQLATTAFVKTEIPAALNASGSAPIYACRAWVNFDGTKDTTGTTSTANTNRLIQGSGNVTSVLRNGVGDYTITFTTAMPDANYSVVGSATYPGVVNEQPTTPVRTTSAIRLYIGTSTTGAPTDYRNASVSIFR